MNAYDLSQLSILIIEKHAPIRRLFRQVLRELGVAHIEEASSTDAGFDLFNEFQPDLLLIDWAPDFDGLSLLNRIRTSEQSSSHSVPVIMVTANTESRQVLEARDGGMTEYLAKPVSAKMLYERIVWVIEREREFIEGSNFTGPDRRRRRAGMEGEERRGANPSADAEADTNGGPGKSANDSAPPEG